MGALSRGSVDASVDEKQGRIVIGLSSVGLRIGTRSAGEPPKRAFQPLRMAWMSLAF